MCHSRSYRESALDDPLVPGATWLTEAEHTQRHLLPLLTNTTYVMPRDLFHYRSESLCLGSTWIFEIQQRRVLPAFWDVNKVKRIIVSHRNAVMRASAYIQDS